MNSQDNGFATAMCELVNGHPGYFYTPNDGNYIMAVDRESGLPIRAAGDCGPDIDWICGFNRGITAYVKQHGLPWNSRLASLDILADLPSWFCRHSEQSTRLELNGGGFSQDDGGFELQWVDGSVADPQTNQHPGSGYAIVWKEYFNGWLRLESQSLFVDPGLVPRAMMAYRSGPPPALPRSLTRPPSLKAGTKFIRCDLLGYAECVECVAAPLDSHLVVFRLSEFTRETMLPYQGAPERFLALDTQLADWIPCHLSRPLFEWPPKLNS